MKEKVAFIGLGEMGLGMALNLLRSGYEVYGFDTKKSVCEEATKKGIIVCDSVEKASRESDNAVISVVRNYSQTESVIFGENGILSSSKDNLTIIVMSTLAPVEMGLLAEKVEKNGHVLVDAPVSGAKSRADDGSLTVMTAGKRESVDKCESYFNAMGSNIFYFGEKAGAAQAAKLSNNLMLGINMVGCAEGLRFGENFGLSSDTLIELLKVSSGNSWVVQNWDVVSKWWYEYMPNETLDIVHKDLHSVLKICFDDKITLPVGALTFSCLLDALKAEA